jgi:hypothetical protein
MKRIYLLLSTIFIFLSVSYSKAQYPFEKYPAIKYEKLKFHSWFNKDSSNIYFKAELSGIANNKEKLNLLIAGPNDGDYLNIYIRNGKKIIQKFREKSTLHVDYNKIDFGSMADFNNDSLTDIKLTFLNWGGCGLAANILKRIYLFQNKNKSFTKISFSDIVDREKFLDMPIKWLPERDINNDGNYKIMTCRLEFYKEHSYLTFDLYEFNNGNLICLDDKYNYPIMVQYLYRENYEVTKKISPEKMKTFKRLKPEGYSKQ